MEDMDDIVSSVYVQEGFNADEVESAVDNAFPRSNSKSDTEIKLMKSRLKNLEAEVSSLRAELRLIKRKFRDVDPYQDKYRDVIEKVVAEALDQQRYWKLVPAQRDPSPSSTSRQNFNPSSKTPGRFTPRLTFNDMMAADSNSDRDMDPLDVSISVSPVVTDDEIAYIKKSRVVTPPSKQKTSAGIKQVASNRFVVDVVQTQPKKLKSKGQKSNQGKVGGHPGSTRRVDPETRQRICERAKVIGPTAAGREFGVPESTIRTWVTKLYEGRNQVERVQVYEEPGDGSNYSENLHQTQNIEDPPAVPTSFGKARKYTKRKYKQYVSTPELKWKACQRAKEIGPTAAGRELNIPEGSIRHWMKFIRKDQSDEEEVEEGNNRDSQPKFEPLFGITSPPLSPFSATLS